MSPLASFLADQVASGVQRIGQIEIRSANGRAPYHLCHAGDVEIDDLERHEGPQQAREISTWSEHGDYRFLKASNNLRRGWRMKLADAEELRQALDGFYPAAVGLWRAKLRGGCAPQNLRDKLGRQTGMYRSAGNLSNEGAQRLVHETCGPARQCAKRILWQLDDTTPLEDCEAARYRGIAAEVPEKQAIPLLCREACNHFVAECRKTAKNEANR